MDKRIPLDLWVYKKFVCSLLEEKKIYEKLRKLEHLAKAYLENLDVRTVEALFFNPVMRDIPKLLYSLLQSARTDADAQQGVLFLLGITINCCYKANRSDGSLKYFPSVPETVLNVLALMFKQCLGNDRCDASSQFVGVAKHYTTILKQALETLLKRTHISPECEKDVATISNICVAIYHFHKHTEKFEVSLQLWEVAVKWILQYRDCLKGRLDFNLLFNTICAICNTAIRKLHITLRCLQAHEVQKELESCSRPLSLIHSMCDELKGMIKPDRLVFLKVVLNVYKIFFVDNADTKEMQPKIKQIESCFSRNIHNFTGIYDREMFFFLTYSINEVKGIVGKDLMLPLLIMKTNFLCGVFRRSNMKDNSRHDLLAKMVESTFEYLICCEESLKLSTNILISPLNFLLREKRSNLYYHLLIRFCLCASKFCSCHFETLEISILKLLCSQNTFLSLLGSDILCYIARMGSSELCFNLCIMVQRLVLPQHNAVVTSNCLNFLTRLSRFLKPDHKKYIQDKLPILRTLECVVSCSVPGRKMPFLLPNRMMLTTKNISQQLNGISHTLSLPDLDASSLLVAILRHAQVILRCLTLAIDIVDMKVLLQYMLLAYVFWNCNDVAIRFEVLGFLRSLKSKRIEDCPEKTKLFFLIENLLALALDEENHLLQYEAMCVYVEYARFTPHKNIITNCLQRCKMPSSELKKFVMLKNTEHNNLELSNIRKHQVQWVDATPTMRSYMHNTNIAESLKQMELESGREKQMSETILALKDCVDKLEQLAPLPSWTSQGIDDVLERLQNLTSNVCA